MPEWWRAVLPLRTALQRGTLLRMARVVDADTVRGFADVVGDHNPLHLDAAFAAQTRFRVPIAHGLLVGSLFTVLFGQSLPGSVYVSQSFVFTAPTPVGARVVALARATHVDVARRRAHFDTVCALSACEADDDAIAHAWLRHTPAVLPPTAVLSGRAEISLPKTQSMLDAGP